MPDVVLLNVETTHVQISSEDDDIVDIHLRISAKGNPTLYVADILELKRKKYDAIFKESTD